MLRKIEKAQFTYASSKDDGHFKQMGQYFTDIEIAQYMASLAPLPTKKDVKILDAGAGAGILTAALIERLTEASPSKITAVLYEIDSSVIPVLKNSMDLAAEYCESKGIAFSYEIRNKDFVLERPDIKNERYDYSSINPPYFKYSAKDSVYSDATQDLFKGNPNIYASFLAIVINSLGPDGHAIAITPRSFANGLYFKDFRRFLVSNSCLQEVHVFKSRNMVFKKKSVLQENVICHFSKADQNERIKIHISKCSMDIFEADELTYDKDLIICSRQHHNIIRIPDTKSQGKILETVNSWTHSFEEAGFTISTGPVVAHRTRKFITTPNDNNGSVRLIKMHNIRPMQATWTGEHKKDARFKLTEGHAKHTSTDSLSIVLRRFTSKDEKKRLVAGISHPQNNDRGIVAYDNHINVVRDKKGELDNNLACGLCALFNSSFMDEYFRAISGNTQVNATEVRLMKLPSRDKIIKIGEKISQHKDFEQSTIDQAVQAVLFTS